MTLSFHPRFPPQIPGDYPVRLALEGIVLCIYAVPKPTIKSFFPVLTPVDPPVSHAFPSSIKRPVQVIKGTNFDTQKDRRVIKANVCEKSPICSHLVKISIPVEEKLSLSQDYSEKDIAYGIKWMKRFNVKINASSLDILKWVCEERPFLPEKHQVSACQRTRTIARQYLRDAKREYQNIYNL